ncbi:MAG: outer membrane beta-barrel protein [Thermodesulfobacteriota bacterium]
MVSKKGISGRTWGGILTLSLVWLMAGPVGFNPAWAGGKIRVTPSVQVKEEYNDNINFSENNRKDDFITTLSPAVAFDYSTELFRLELSAGYNVTRYASESTKDKDLERYSFQSQYQMTERFRFNLGGAYSKDTTLEAELERAGIVYETRERKLYRATGGFNYVTSERSNLDVSYTRGRTEYESPGRADVDTEQATGSFNFMLLNQRDTISLQPFYSSSRSESLRTQIYGLSAGWSHYFNENWSMSASAGLRRWERQTSSRARGVRVPPYYWIMVADEDERKSEWGGVVNLALTRLGEKHRATLRYSRDYDYGAYGEMILTDKCLFDVNWDVWERLSAGFAGGVTLTSTESRNNQVDRTYYSLGPSLSYSLTENITVRLNYYYGKYHETVAGSDHERYRHLVSAMFNFNFPVEW